MTEGPGAKQAKRRASDFFISYARPDQKWAEWITVQLEALGFRVVLDVWTWTAGSNFVAQMDESLRSVAKVLMLVSEAALDPTSFAAEERWAALVGSKHKGQGAIPVIVGECELPPLLATLVAIDLVGCDEYAARQRLIDGVLGPPSIRPHVMYPGNSQAQLGSTTVPIQPGKTSNLPTRNRNFTGRAKHLADIYIYLNGGENRPLVLHGTGGVGKTQIVSEYAYRHSEDYDTILWVAADQATLIAEQLASLAYPIGLPAGAPLPEAAAAILDLLSQRTKWLLIFDGAPSPESVAPYLIAGTGHVLITSQQRGWGAVAEQMEVGVFARADSVRLLRGRVRISEQLAAELAAELGDLPLAIEQVAAYLDGTGTPPAEYLHMFRAKAGPLLDGEALGYQRTVATTWALSLERIESESEPALRLLEVLSFFASDPVALDLFSGEIEFLTGSLGDALSVPFALSRLVGTLVHYSLAVRHADGLEVHRLLQAAIRDQLSSVGTSEVAADLARALLLRASPDTDGPDTWPRWAQIIPHLLGAPAIAQRSDDAAVRKVLLNVGRYLYVRGDYRAARDLSASLMERWSPSLGADHPDVLTAGKNLASPLVGLGEYRQAEELHRRVYLGRKRSLGDTDLLTLNSASDLADTLRLAGNFEAAKLLNETTYARLLETVGPRHIDALRCANNCANDLYGLGLYVDAMDLDMNTLRLRAESLGETHPDTLVSAANLATDVAGEGDFEEARRILQQTYNAFLEVLVPNHPDVLATANNLAVCLHALGRKEMAERRFRETHRGFRRVLGEAHPYTIDLIMAIRDPAAARMLRI